jgi:hypothetical protein
MTMHDAPLRGSCSCPLVRGTPGTRGFQSCHVRIAQSVGLHEQVAGWSRRHRSVVRRSVSGAARAGGAQGVCPPPALQDGRGAHSSCSAPLASADAPDSSPGGHSNQGVQVWPPGDMAPPGYAPWICPLDMPPGYAPWMPFGCTMTASSPGHNASMHAQCRAC